MIKASSILKSNTEAAHQSCLIAWSAIAVNFGFEQSLNWLLNDEEPYPTGDLLALEKSPCKQLRWLHHIPNAGARGNKIAAAHLAAQGLKAGVADIFLPVKSKTGLHAGYSGLYLELKKPDCTASSFSDKQLEFALFVIQENYSWVPTFGAHHAIYEILFYLNAYDGVMNNGELMAFLNDLMNLSVMANLDKRDLVLEKLIQSS